MRVRTVERSLLEVASPASTHGKRRAIIDSQDSPASNILKKGGTSKLKYSANIYMCTHYHQNSRHL